MRAPGLGVEEACHGALSGQRTAGEDWTCPGFRVSLVRSILHDEPTQEAEARVGVRFLTEAFKHLDQAMPETLFPIFFLSYINVNFPTWSKCGVVTHSVNFTDRPRVSYLGHGYSLKFGPP